MNSNTSTQTATQKPAAPTYAQQTEIPAAWREFSAGMECLHRYGTHNTANTGAIGRDNLRLLHRSLLQDSVYRNQVNNARKTACKGKPQHGHPTRATLLASSQLSAQLISIPADSSIRLTVRPGELGMLMIISGLLNTTQQIATHTRSNWWFQGWRVKRRVKPSLSQLKTDDIICVTHHKLDDKPGASVLSTRKKACVVLAVFSSQQFQPSQTPPHTGALPPQSALLHNTL